VLRTVKRRFSLPLELDELPYGSEYYLKTGFALPREERLRIGRDYNAILLGAVGDPRVPDNFTAREIVLGLRFDLDLYMNIRPVQLLDDRFGPLKGKTREDIDFVVVRENTEGIYGGIGGQQHGLTVNEVAIATMLYTYRGVHRVILGAFELARRLGRTRVCLVHKANAVPQVFMMWIRVFRQVAEQFPDIEPSDMLVDRAAMEMIRAPEQFDVVVTSNLLGDILTDLAAQIAGGMGLAASANVHPGRTSLFEPVHGSAPDIAGKGLANPLASCLSAAMLLEHLGFAPHGRLVEDAVRQAIEGNHLTRDLGGQCTTHEVGQVLADYVAHAPLPDVLAAPASPPARQTR
jgi:3-isopropylmalate dehydrogenase